MNHDLSQLSDELIERALAYRAPRGADTDLLHQIAAAAAGMPQASRLWPVRLPWMGEPARRLVWVAVVLLLMLAFALGAIVAGGLGPSPALVVEPLPSGTDPSPTPEPSVDPNAASVAPSVALGPSPWPVVAIEDGAFKANPGTTYTSRLFEPRITFEIDAAAPNARPSGEWCPGPHSSARMIVLRHAKGCVTELDIIRPFAVECGLTDVHPDAAALTQAVLLQLGTAAVEMGARSGDGAVPANLFAEPYPRHAIQIHAAGQPRAFDAEASDPDGCRLLPEPGGDDPVIEIRGDIASTLILFDVDGELIVVRAALGGHDAASGAEALEGGYAFGGSGNMGLLHLLQVNHHIRFD